MVIEPLAWFVERAVEYSMSAFVSWDHFVAALGEIGGTFTRLSSGFAWPYLLASLIIAVTAFTLARRYQRPAPALKEFLFPHRVYGHPSAMLDYRFYVVTAVLTALLWGPMLLGVGVLAEKIVKGLWVGYALWNPPSTLSPAGLLGAVFAFYLLQDLASYWAHVAFHKIPLLWAFHKVHHSAEVLTPVTAYRAHPLEFFVFAVPKAPVAAAATLFYQNISPHDMELTMVFGVSIIAFMYGLTGFHLQHSHLPISYGSLCDRIIISPVLHQVHHSADTRHLDKNFGVKFALWDWLFGTLYLPERNEAIRIGLGDRGGASFKTIRDLYFRPFADCMRSLRLDSRVRMGSFAPASDARPEWESSR